MPSPLATILWGRLATCGRVALGLFALANGRPTPAAPFARQVTLRKPTHIDCGSAALYYYALSSSRAAKIPRAAM
jgi:hypothetical protein